MISVTKQLDVHDTGLVGNGRGRTEDFLTTWTWTCGRAGWRLSGTPARWPGFYHVATGQTDALGGHADVHMFIAYLRQIKNGITTKHHLLSA